MYWIERFQHLRVVQDADETQHPDGPKPHHHDGSKRLSNGASPPTLNSEKTYQNHNSDGHRIRLEEFGRDIETFHCTQNRNGRGDDAVAINERGAE